MNPLLFVPGLALVLIAALEVLWTTLWIDGASAPLTGLYMKMQWRVLRSVSRPGRRRLLSLNGPLTLAMTIVGWVMLLWIGWVLMFLSDPDALVHGTTSQQADLAGRIYFAAYVLSTMGHGDYQVEQGFWEIVTSFTSLSGILFLTLSVTYIIQVISATVNKRSFADTVTGFGMRAEEMVLALWNGRDFGSVELLFDSLRNQLGALTEQHLAYPILHYYHAREDRKTSTAAAVVLDEALSLIAFGVRPEVRPSSGIILSTRRAVESYLQSLRTAFVSAADREPPAPDLSVLRDAGVPTVDDSEFLAALHRNADRRKVLLGMTENAGRRWPGREGQR